MACPLCQHNLCTVFYSDKRRDYLRCQRCQLVFVPPQQHLSPTAEKAIYDLHQNQLDDLGYRRFLSRLTQPMLESLSSGAEGLDFGCGPGPLLAQMFREQGFQMETYDPFYANHPELLQRRYDFITCSEVVEHLRQPQPVFAQLFDMLKPQGLLGIMTKLVIDAEAFSRWHYKNDLTHISFFSEATMQWIADQQHCQLALFGKDVVIFSKTR